MAHPLALLADIGGTHARFALADITQPAPLIDASIRQFEVARFASVEDAAESYLDQAGATRGMVEQGVFAVAGRVEGDNASITNHPWHISGTEAQKALGLRRMRLVNDFAAQAMAMNLLTDTDLVS